MAKTRPLTQLVPDLRSALSLASERVAHDVTLELKKRGPYWSGDFEENWEVKAGQTSIRADVAGIDWSLVPERLDKQITPPIVPPADDRLLGYTIGNRMEYREIAMDLRPGPDGRFRWQWAGSSAQRNWYENYLGGGDARATIERATTMAMRLGGF